MPLALFQNRHTRSRLSFGTRYLSAANLPTLPRPVLASSSGQTSHVPRICSRPPGPGSHLQSCPFCQGAQLQRSSPTCAPQHQHPSLEIKIASISRPFSSGHVGIRIPSRVHSTAPPAPHSGNHPSANQFPADVSAFITKDLHLSAIIGPPDHHPFQWTLSNPMMTRPKKDSATRRVIVDLSMPQDASVNSGIPRNALDGAPFKLRLPNPATLANKILQHGQGCLLYKVDLSRAYRQLRTDPLD